MSQAEAILYHASHINAVASFVMASLIFRRVLVQKDAILLGGSLSPSKIQTFSSPLEKMDCFQSCCVM